MSDQLLAPGPPGGIGGESPWQNVDYPAFTMGAAADMLGVAPGFLRALGEQGLLNPQRSGGGHRRYTGRELHLAAQARVLVDEGLRLEAACRIVALQAELAVARAEIARLRDQLGQQGTDDSEVTS